MSATKVPQQLRLRHSFQSPCRNRSSSSSPTTGTALRSPSSEPAPTTGTPMGGSPLHPGKVAPPPAGVGPRPMTVGTRLRSQPLLPRQLSPSAQQRLLQHRLLRTGWICFRPSWKSRLQLPVQIATIGCTTSSAPSAPKRPSPCSRSFSTATPSRSGESPPPPPPAAE